MDDDKLFKSILSYLKQIRFDLSSEKATQSEIESKLEFARYPFFREVHLSKKDIPDFMVEGVCIEVKLKGSSAEIYRQIERYSKHDLVSHIILITNKAMRLPNTINEKQTAIINLGSAWL